MKPSLNAARRAMLELQAMPTITSVSEIGVRLSIISTYLEAQVALNVESLPAIVGAGGMQQLGRITRTAEDRIVQWEQPEADDPRINNSAKHNFYGHVEIGAGGGSSSFPGAGAGGGSSSFLGAGAGGFLPCSMAGAFIEDGWYCTTHNCPMSQCKGKKNA